MSNDNIQSVTDKLSETVKELEQLAKDTRIIIGKLDDTKTGVETAFDTFNKQGETRGKQLETKIVETVKEANSEYLSNSEKSVNEVLDPSLKEHIKEINNRLQDLQGALTQQNDSFRSYSKKILSDSEKVIDTSLSESRNTVEDSLKDYDKDVKETRGKIGKVIDGFGLQGSEVLSTQVNSVTNQIQELLEVNNQNLTEKIEELQEQFRQEITVHAETITVGYQTLQNRLIEIRKTSIKEIETSFEAVGSVVQENFIERINSTETLLESYETQFIDAAQSISEEFKNEAERIMSQIGSKSSKQIEQDKEELEKMVADINGQIDSLTEQQLTTMRQTRASLFKTLDDSKDEIIVAHSSIQDEVEINSQEFLTQVKEKMTKSMQFNTDKNKDFVKNHKKQLHTHNEQSFAKLSSLIKEISTIIKPYIESIKITSEKSNETIEEALMEVRRSLQSQLNLLEDGIKHTGESLETIVPHHDAPPAP
ncbi:MAG: hypothetical protein ACTSYA_08555 [Candidatus Kariarchaeaceae archaeon]